MAKPADLPIGRHPGYGFTLRSAFAGLLAMMGGAAASYLAGCDPASPAADKYGLSGCWAVADTTYIEAGRPSYDSGTLVLAQHDADLTGEIAWRDPSRPADSVTGRWIGDTLSLTLTPKGDSEGATLKGAIGDADRFSLAWYAHMPGSSVHLSAARLPTCPEPYYAETNPRKLRLQTVRDSMPVAHLDSTGLESVAAYAYSGDSDVVRFSGGYDTLTFTYRSYQDRSRASKSISGEFSLLTTPQGEKVIYGKVYPYYSDVIILGDSTEYSLNETVLIPGGLPKGKYKLVINLRVICFCLPGPGDFYRKEFIIE